MAQWLTITALALFVVNAAVLALGAHAYGWAAVLFAGAAYIAVSTGVLGHQLSPVHRRRSDSR